MASKKFANGDYISFVIDDKTYSVPILKLIGAIGNPQISTIEEPIDSVVGFINLESGNIPVFDLRVILNKKEVQHKNKTCVLITQVLFENQERAIGFVIDSLSHIYNLQQCEFENISPFDKNEFIQGIAIKNEQIIAILNLNNVVKKADVNYFLNVFWGNKKNMDCTKKNGV